VTRFQAALRRARRVVWGVLAVGILALAALPSQRAWTWALDLGLLVGIMNTNLLASAVRRAVVLPSAPARAALTVSGAVRYGLVLALLAWVLLKGPPVQPAVLVAALLLPETLVALGVVLGHEPFDATRPTEATDATDASDSEGETR
jgi:hypothetical protein